MYLYIFVYMKVLEVNLEELSIRLRFGSMFREHSVAKGANETSDRFGRDAFVGMSIVSIRLRREQMQIPERCRFMLHRFVV